jgi:hypothetical protein
MKGDVKKNVPFSKEMKISQGGFSTAGDETTNDGSNNGSN